MPSDLPAKQARLPKLQVTFPPRIYGRGRTAKNQVATVKRMDVPLAFRRAKGRISAMFLDVVIDAYDASGNSKRRVLHQYVLTIQGSDGKLLLKPLDNKVASVEPEFAGALLLRPVVDDDDDEEEGGPVGESDGDSEADNEGEEGDDDADAN